MEHKSDQEDNSFIKIEGLQQTNMAKSQQEDRNSDYEHQIDSESQTKVDFQKRSMTSKTKNGHFIRKYQNLDGSNFVDLLQSRKQIYNNLSRKISSQSQNRNVSQNLNPLQSMQSQDHILSSNMIYELSSLDNIPNKKTRYSVYQQQQNDKYQLSKRDSLSYTVLQDKLNIHNQQILKHYSSNLGGHQRNKSSMAESKYLKKIPNLQESNNQEVSQQSVLQIDQKYILDLHNAINQQFIKNEDIFKLFEMKLSKLEELQDLILQYDLKNCIKQQDVSQFQQTLRLLLNELRVQSQNQIDNNRLQRQIEQKNTEIMNLKYSIKKMEQKSEFLLQQSSYYKDKNTDIQKEIIKQKRTILDVQKQNEENKQMNKRIKRRLEVVLEFDLKKKENSEEKRILTIQELMRDNEYYKRMLEVKNNEIQQNHSKFSKLQDKIDKYSQIIRILKDNKKSFDTKQQFSNNDLLQTLSSDKLPESLRFLNFQQKQETSLYIEQMLYHGLQVYQSNQEYEQMDQKKQQAIIKQFIIDRDVFSRLNTLLQIMIDIGQGNSINSIQSINQIFNQKVKKYVIDCDNINIWEIEQQTGLLVTQFYTEKKRGYSDFGAFADCISKKQCIIQQNYSKRVFYKNILESQQKQNYYVDNFFLIPLTNQYNKIIGLIELSNELKKDVHQQKEFGFQEQYLCQVIKLFLNIFIQKLKEKQVYQIEIHNNQNLQNNYTQMLACSNRVQLTQQTQMCLKQILGITNFRLYFVEQSTKDSNVIQKMEFYEELYNQQSKLYDYEKRTIVGSKGIVGFVGQYQGANIINNLKDSIHYDSNVDLYSVLPVYTLPIIKKNEHRQDENLTIGVLQIVLKQRISTKIIQEEQMNDDVQIGLSETSENIAKLIVNGISVAIQNLK